MPVQAALAQYACDHCKQRKLRCSRETPICSNCKAWSGACVYSRYGRIRRRPRSKAAPAPSSFEDKSTKIELPHLPPPNDSCSASSSTYNDQSEKYVRSKGLSERMLEGDHGPPIYAGPSPTVFSHSQPNHNISDLSGKFGEQSFRKNVANNLSELSETFSALNFEDPSNVRRNVRNFRRNNELFFIPEKEEGIQLIQMFTKAIEKGNPFFTIPPPELLPKLVFQPSNVQERGWLLLFNALLSTNLSLMKSSDTRLNQGLQWNTWMLIEDSGVFLDPSEINIQALLLVATHSQDISTPSLCWTLISHACQMAQTLALHLPKPGSPKKNETNLQRNCLFWSLFIIDKSLSLSFGRPPLLPGYLYKEVPPLDPTQLAQYRPHLNYTPTPCGGTENLSHREFGTFYIMQLKALANLQAETQDSLQRDGGSNRTNLVNSLDLWMETTQQSSSIYECCPLGSGEDKAIQLGINNLTFQYHYLMVYLTKGNKIFEKKCLASARSAIALLDSLVASSAQVYNGIVWQLLYQPFMPYFVLFGKILSNPHSSDCFTDLQLLRKVVLYFLQMHNNHQSAKKLEKVAETFTKLAEAFVRHSLQEPQQPTLEGQAGYREGGWVSKHALAGNTDTAHSTRDHNFSQFPSDSPTPSLSIPSWEIDQALYDFDDLESDPITLLSFFTTPSANFSPMGSSHASAAISPMHPLAPQPQQPFSGGSDWDKNPLMRGLENIAQSYGLDGSFDWFSWEQYNNS